MIHSLSPTRREATHDRRPYCGLSLGFDKLVSGVSGVVAMTRGHIVGDGGVSPRLRSSTCHGVARRRLLFAGLRFSLFPMFTMVGLLYYMIYSLSLMLLVLLGCFWTGWITNYGQSVGQTLEQ